jgi:tyrosinase
VLRGWRVGRHAEANQDPLDPIFWVHHAQIDRLWWRYQQRAPANISILDYQGPLTLDEKGWPSQTWDASLDDEFNMWGMGPNITVREIMSTETDILCYRYPDAV